MKLSKTALGALNAQYRAVLRKCFLLSMAAIVGLGMATSASAQSLTVNTSENITNPTTGTQQFGDQEFGDDVYNYTDITVNDGSLTLNDFKIRSDADLDIIDGTVTLNHGGLRAHSGDMTIQGGTVTGTNDSSINAGTVAISGGTINFSGGEIGADTTMTISGAATDITLTDDATLGAETSLTIGDGTIDATDSFIGSLGTIGITGGNITLDGSEIETRGDALTISGGSIDAKDGSNIIGKTTAISGTSTVISLSGHSDLAADVSLSMTDGTLNMNNGRVGVNGTNDTGNHWIGGAIGFNGGTVNVTGGADNAFLGATTLGTELNIQNGATLSTYKDFTKDAPGVTGNLLSLGDRGEITMTSSGVINLGGTLNSDVTGGAGTLNIIAGNSTINGEVEVGAFTTDTGANLTLDGGDIDILNNGNITISTGAVTLKNASELETKTGILTISGGTYNVESGSTTIGKTTVVSGGTVNLSGNGEFAAKDSITMSSGEINMNNGYAIVEGTHNGGDNYTAGAIALNGGKVNVTAGSNNWLVGATTLGGEINVANGSILSVYNEFDITPQDVIIPGVKGEIAMSGAGAINLSGKLVSDVSGAGELNFKTSSAVVDGGVTGAKLTFDASNSLSNAITGTIGTLASVDVNAGTLTYDKDATSLGDVTVFGNAGLDIGDKTLKAGVVDFKDNSTMAFTITSKTAYGNIDATSVNIGTNGTNLNLTLNSAALAKDEEADFTLFNVAATGAFENLSENSRYIFTDNGDGKTFHVIGKASASDIVEDAGGTSNNAGTAEAWDSVDTSTETNQTTIAVANTLAQLSNSANPVDTQKYVDALTALAPESAAMVQSVSTEVFGVVNRAIASRMSGGFNAPVGKSSGDTATEKGAVWVQGLYNYAKLDDSGSVKGFDADTYGLAIGAEMNFTSDIKGGLSYAYTNSDVDGFQRDTDVDTHTAILYGEYKPSNWYVNGIMSYGWSSYDEKRNVGGVTVDADYDANTFVAQALTGYEFKLNDGFSLTPEGGLRYMNIDIDGYTDSAGQSVKSNSIDVLTGIFGVKAAKEFAFDGGKVRPEARLGVTYDFVNDDANSVVSLANGSSYRVKGEALEEFGFEFGAGVTAELNKQWELSLGYEGKIRKDYQDHTGLLRVKYNF